MSNAGLIRERLESKLEPLHLRVLDESAQHAGHAGARTGGDSHFTLEIVSQRFTGLSRVARHRLIYEALGDAFEQGLHALRIDAKAPGE
jgi:BolA protein